MTITETEQNKNNAKIYDKLGKVIKTFGKFDLECWQILDEEDCRILEEFRHSMSRIQAKYTPKKEEVK